MSVLCPLNPALNLALSLGSEPPELCAGKSESGLSARLSAGQRHGLGAPAPHGAVPSLVPPPMRIKPWIDPGSGIQGFALIQGNDATAAVALDETEEAEDYQGECDGLVTGKGTHQAGGIAPELMEKAEDAVGHEVKMKVLPG